MSTIERTKILKRVIYHFVEMVLKISKDTITQAILEYTVIKIQHHSRRSLQICLKAFESMYELSELCVAALATVTSFFDEACKEKYTPIEIVYNYIGRNYSKMITLEDITEFYPYSKSKLCHAFKRIYKMSVFDMLMKTRLKNARYMIKNNPNIKLIEVASSCGFNDVSYFCKVYKKFYGESPKNTK